MAVEFKDYYDILKVSRTASDGEIKQAYYNLARMHHPDIHPEKEKDLHTRRMQEINEAYSVLGSKENRTKYDRLGEKGEHEIPQSHPSQDRGAGGFSGQGSEAFSDFFRNMFRQSDAKSEPEDLYPSELDIEASLDLSLQDAVNGAEKSFTLMAAGLCRICRGTGRKNSAFCPACGGVGEVRHRREVKSKIPPGLSEGSRIRLKAQGNEDRNARGDLYLKIHLLSDPNFKVNGMNVETNVRLMPWQAALGSLITVMTLEGSLQLRVPKGTQGGSRLRLAGKGLGKPGKRGDLFIRMEIDIPHSLSPKSEALFKQLEEESHVRAS